ncbi:MAG: CBS domain-containing protein [Myxococcota bacterium]
MKTPLRQLLAHKGRRVQSCHPAQTVIEAVHLMNDLKIGALVVFEGTRLVGIFTERDVMVRVVAKRLDPQTTRVRDVMTTSVITLAPTATVEQAMRTMIDNACRHIPVAESDEVLGLVSLRDLSNWTVRAQQQELDQLAGYMYRSYPN